MTRCGCTLEAPACSEGKRLWQLVRSAFMRYEAGRGTWAEYRDAYRKWQAHARAWNWWRPTRRTAYIITDWDGNVLDAEGILEADEVICDLCNAWVTVRPVPVSGSYALCPKCFKRMFGLTVAQAAEQDGIPLTELEL